MSKGHLASFFVNIGTGYSDNIDEINGSKLGSAQPISYAAFVLVF